MFGVNFCVSFQAHKPIRPNARGFSSLVEGGTGNRIRHGRRLRDDARVKYRKKIVYHICAACACLTASPKLSNKEREVV